MEGVNKKLGLFGDYVDIFKGIPFAAPPKALENPQRHPGWQGGRGQGPVRPRAWGGRGAAAVLTPAPRAARRNPEGQGLQEAVPAGHHHPGQHLRGRGLPLPQHLGPPGQEGRWVRPPRTPQVAPGPCPRVCGAPEPNFPAIDTGCGGSRGRGAASGVTGPAPLCLSLPEPARHDLDLRRCLPHGVRPRGQLSQQLPV